MAFISMHGMLDLKVVSGNVDGDIYSDFIEKSFTASPDTI